MRTRRAHQPRELLQRCPWLQQVCVETGQSSVLRNHSKARRVETERNRMQSVSADSCVVEGQSSERLTEGVASGQQLQKNKFPFPQRACRDSWAPQNYENHFKGPSYTQKAPQASETFPPPPRQRRGFILGQKNTSQKAHWVSAWHATIFSRAVWLWDISFCPPCDWLNARGTAWGKAISKAISLRYTAGLSSYQWPLSPFPPPAHHSPLPSLAPCRRYGEAVNPKAAHLSSRDLPSVTTGWARML